MGVHSLPYGLNVFPINQYGRDGDYMLSLDMNNCPYFGQKWAVRMGEIDAKYITLLEN